MAEYVPHAVPSKISVTSRSAIKIKDNFYTVEVYQERTISSVDLEGIDMEKEYIALFDEVNKIVDDQCKEIVETFR